MRPLEGLKILDLSRVLACPFASMILAEMGAQVIKVEQPVTGDETRHFEPRVEGENGSESAYFFAFNRSKESITVNLRSEDGQKIIHDLAQQADVFLENFPVGTLEKYKLHYDAIRQSNPDIVYVSCTGFGMTGPYSPRKGYDTVFQAMGGIMSLTGERGGGPVKPGLPVADLTSGLWIVIAILTAMVGKDRNGHGCHVDFSMFDGQVGLLSLAAARYFTLGEVPARLGTEHPGRVPSAAFECADGKWVQITGSDQHWKPLCELLGLNDWATDDVLAKNAERVRRRDEVMQGLQQAIQKLDRSRLCELCDERGVPAGPILSVDEIFADPHVTSRELVQHFAHPQVGQFQGIAVPFKFTGYDNPVMGRPPLLGEHTAKVLKEKLGLTEAQIEGLSRLKAI